VKTKLTYGGLVYNPLVISITASKRQAEGLNIIDSGSATAGKCPVGSCYRPISTVHSICY